MGRPGPGQRSVISATPSAMAARSQSARSCSASGTRAPSGPVRAGRRASVSSISASSPATSPSSGSSRCSGAGQTDRLGASGRAALQVGAGGAGVALVEDQVEHVQHDAQALGALGRRRQRERRARRPGCVCLARLMRWAIVASGRGRRRAISAVVRPPTARRVSASCEAGDSAGWQHRKSSVSVSSSSAVGGVVRGRRPRGRRGGGDVLPAPARLSLRSWSISRREATVISQPRGLSGCPRRATARRRRAAPPAPRPRTASKCAVAADERAEDLRRELAQQVLDPGPGLCLRL